MHPFLRQITPIGGQLTAHLFENRQAGVPRGLYWCLRLDLAPFRHEDDDWDCSVGCEWLTFKLDRWIELDGRGHADLLWPEGAESSMYLYDQHQPMEIEALRLRRSAGATFEVEVSLRGELMLPDETTERSARVGAKAVVPFEGITLMRDNLFPKPSSEVEAAALLEPFIRCRDFEPPSEGEFSYVFVPRPEAR